MEPLYLTIPEAAKAVGLCREMIYREMRAGRLPVARTGRATRIPADALRQWAAARVTTWAGEPWDGGAA